MNKTLIIIAIALIIGISASTFYFYERSEIVKTQNDELNKNLANFAKIYDSLADSYVSLLKKTNYSISLSPVIDTKVSSILGSSRQLTFQYYFTMDGNKILLKPDSTITLTK